jgi:hypothetical protein
VSSLLSTVSLLFFVKSGNQFFLLLAGHGREMNMEFKHEVSALVIHHQG